MQIEPMLKTDMLGERLAVPQFSEKTHRTRTVVACSSLLLAVLQSVCTFFAALDGLRVAIGASSLVLAAGTATRIDSFHTDWLRVPMIAAAIFGSVVNLVVLWQVWRLRRRPEAAWRRSAPNAQRSRMERLQLVLSIVTLIVLTLEERQHLIWLHHL